MIIKVEVDWKNSNNKYNCPYCGKEYSKKGISTHIWRSHTDDGLNFDPFKDYKVRNKGMIPWNKGLTQENNPIIKSATDKLKDGYKSGRIKSYFTNRILFENHRENISKGMILAHEEGRAWNIGMSRWNNKPSYPEEFFMKVIEIETFLKQSSVHRLIYIIKYLIQNIDF